MVIFVNRSARLPIVLIVCQLLCTCALCAHVHTCAYNPILHRNRPFSFVIIILYSIFMKICYFFSHNFSIKQSVEMKLYNDEGWWWYQSLISASFQSLNSFNSIKKIWAKQYEEINKKKKNEEILVSRVKM